MKRRAFLKKTAALAGATVAAPIFVPSSVFGSNAPSNRITIGCIGVGGMGTAVMRGFMNNPNAEVVSVCDVDTAHRENARLIANLSPKRSYKDFRKLLLRDDIDAVTVVTPDHWHVPISLAAVAAGKDVYCEKPLTLTITEGRTLTNAVRRYGRVLQTGSHQRSDDRFRFACELVRNERIGKLQEIAVEIPENSRTCPPTWEEMPIPEGFDYNMWLGPAKYEPYTKQRCHYSFRFLLDYSGGQLTNWGAHDLDIAQWALDADTGGPVEINAQGEFPREGLFTTATKSHIEYTYANGVKLICDTGGNGVTFRGSEGWIFVKRGHIDAYPRSILNSAIGPEEIRLYESSSHVQDFIDCMKERRKPAADVEIGHRSATVCHLGNIAMILGRRLQWNPEKERFVNDPEANRMLSRPIRNSWQRNEEPISQQG